MANSFDHSKMQIIRRSSKRLFNIKGEAEDLLNVSDLMRLPEYDYLEFPYILVRSKHHVSIVNVRTCHIYNLVSDMKPNFDNEFSAVVPNGKIDEGGSITIIFSSSKQDAVTDTIRTMTLDN